MKDGNRVESGWDGDQYEWQGGRRVDVGANRDGRAAREKNGHPTPDRIPAREEDTEDEWRDDEEDEYEEPENGRRGEEKKRSSVGLLTTIQVIGCCAVLAAALALRMTGGKLYTDFRSWYAAAANDSIIAQEQMDQARRTVIGFWNTISSAGPQQPAASGAGSAGSLSSAPAASSAAPVSSVPSSAAGSAANQNNAAENGASGAAGKGAPSSP